MNNQSLNTVNEFSLAAGSLKIPRPEDANGLGIHKQSSENTLLSQKLNHQNEPAQHQLKIDSSRNSSRDREELKQSTKSNNNLEFFSNQDKVN